MPVYALPSANLSAGTGDADGATGPLTTSISRDAGFQDPSFQSPFGLGYRQQSGEEFRVTLGGIYSGSAAGSFSAHCRCAVYTVTFAFRARSLPSAEQALVGISSNINGNAGAITIDQTGAIRLYSYAAGTFASRVDVAAINGQSNPLVTAGADWYAVQFYIDWGEGFPVPATVALAVGQIGSTPTVVGVNPTSGAFLPTTGGLGHESAYLTDWTFMKAVGFTAPTTSGDYDFSALTITQSESDPGVSIPYGGLSGYSLYAPPVTMQLSQGLTPLIPSSVISAGNWLLFNGSALDARAVRDYGPSAITTGGIKSATANDPLTILYAAPAGFLPANSAGYAISFFTASAPGSPSGTIAINGGTPIAVPFIAGSWTTLWVRNTSADASPTITLTHPNNTTTVTIQNLIVQVVGQPSPYSANNNITVATGVYTGNDAAQSIACGFSPDWICLGPADGSSKGVLWWESMIFPQDWSTSTLRSSDLTPTATGFDVVGAAAPSNLSGKVYRWYAILDDHRRGLYRGASANVLGATATLGSPLTTYNCPPPTFTTIGLWAFKESFSPVNNANGGYYRGPGHTGLNSSPSNATQVTTGIRALPGTTWVAGSDLTQCEPQLSFTAWALNWYANKLWAVTAYTGNGAGGTRVVALDLNGYLPGWVMVVPHNAVSYLRHSSHAPTVSQEVAFGATVTTAITAFGSNSVTVGTDLNANGVIYDVLALIDPSSTSGGGGGGGSGSIEDTDPAGLGCVLTFGSGTDTGGGSGCTPILAGGSDSGGGAGCQVTL